MNENDTRIDGDQQSATTTPQAPTPSQYPSPLFLREMAEREPERKRVDDYAEAISKLRDEKRFSYRAIAEWLCEHGVPTDHNEVYRTHKAYCEGAAKRFFERSRRQLMSGQS